MEPPPRSGAGRQRAVTDPRSKRSVDERSGRDFRRLTSDVAPRTCSGGDRAQMTRQDRVSIRAPPSRLIEYPPRGAADPYRRDILTSGSRAVCRSCASWLPNEVPASGCRRGVARKRRERRTLKSDMPTSVLYQPSRREQDMAVMIGVDPHKGSHTAVALDDNEQPLGELRVRSAAGQLERLVEWAEPFPSGRGQSRVPAGSATCWHSSSSPPASGSSTCNRSWPPGCVCWPPGTTNKNDPNDARSVAVAALRTDGRLRYASRITPR